MVWEKDDEVSSLKFECDAIIRYIYHEITKFLKI